MNTGTSDKCLEEIQLVQAPLYTYCSRRFRTWLVDQDLPTSFGTAANPEDVEEVELAGTPGADLMDQQEWCWNSSQWIQQHTCKLRTYGFGGDGTANTGQVFGLVVEVVVELVTLATPWNHFKVVTAGKHIQILLDRYSGTCP